MITMTRKPRNVKPASGTTTLTIGINGTDYQVLRLRPHPEVASTAFRLRKPDGTVYDVALTPHGHECSCADFTFHRDGKDSGGCKHLKALRAWGMLPPVLTPAAPALPDDDPFARIGADFGRWQ